MEIQLQELIEQIKKEGVAAAEAEAQEIIDNANADAQKIIADAKAEADRIIALAKAENERMVRSSEDAIRQAGRNLLISFRESVTRELNAIIGENVNAIYSSESLTQIIVKAVENWAEKPDAENISVILSESDLQSLEELLLGAMKEKLSKGIILRSSDSLNCGFRISVNDTGAYYDYSAEAVVEMLSAYLSPKVSNLLKEA